MSTVLESDLVLVERSNTVYQERVEDLMHNAVDSDLLAVERGGTVYKETWGDLKDVGPYMGPQETMSLTNTSGTPQVIAATTLPTTFYNVGSGDYSGAYRTCDTRVNVWYYSGKYHYQDSYWTGYLYFGQKNTANTSWQGDMSIGNIQILQGDGRAYRHFSGYPGAGQDWCFANSNNAGSGSWYTSTSTQNYGTSTPSAPSGLSFTSIGTSMSARRWARTTSTGSSYCGANNGTSPFNTNISTQHNYPCGGGAKILPAHNGTVSQYNYSYYACVETTGMNTNDIAWMRTKQSVRIYNGDILRFSYGGGMGQSSYAGTSAAGTFWWYLN
jgi:hypothetical protein